MRDTGESGALGAILRDASVALAILSASIIAVIALYQAGVLGFFGLPYDLNEPSPTQIFNVLGDMFKVAFQPGVQLLLFIPIVAVLVVPSRTLDGYWRETLFGFLVLFGMTPWIKPTWQLLFFVPAFALARVVVALCDQYTNRTRTAASRSAERPVPAETSGPQRTAARPAGVARLSTGLIRLIAVVLVLIPDAYYAGFQRFQENREIHVADVGSQGHPHPVAIVLLGDTRFVGVNLERDSIAPRYHLPEAWHPIAGVVIQSIEAGSLLLVPCRSYISEKGTRTYPDPYLSYGDDGSIGQSLSAGADRLQIYCYATLPPIGK